MAVNKNTKVYEYPLWAKWLFLPFYSLWIGWLYILGAKITIKFETDGWERRLE